VLRAGDTDGYESYASSSTSSSDGGGVTTDGSDWTDDEADVEAAGVGPPGAAWANAGDGDEVGLAGRAMSVSTDQRGVGGGLHTEGAEGPLGRHRLIRRQASHRVANFLVEDAIHAMDESSSSSEEEEEERYPPLV
jgi:hypothetical protein